MKGFGKIVFVFILFFLVNKGFSQGENTTFLQGIIYGDNYSNVIGTIYISQGVNEVKIRHEYINEETDFIVYNASKSEKNGQLVLTETTSFVQKLSLKNRLCKAIISLEKEDQQGYWKGTIKSMMCRELNYKVICFPSNLPFNETKQNFYNNYWVQEFQKNLAKGYPSPRVMEQLRANFKLFTIYFNYDKFDIRTEYYERLNEMVMVVDGHSDFRIKITGHTDGDGSDGYNDGLSENRAQAIKNYFVARGVPEHKVVIDFKGKRHPVDSNKTSEGKQKNRRVIIEFI